MFRRKLRFGLVGGMSVVAIGFMAVAAAEPVGWTNPGTPVIQKAGQLPDNVSPVPTNRDCDLITTRMHGSDIMRENCVINTAYGLSGTEGTIFTGTTETVPVAAPWPHRGLMGVPNQAMAYTYLSPPTPGMYMYFYKSMYSDLKYEYRDNRWQYTKQTLPEISLRNKSGNRLYIHSSNVAFSKNGNWMIADAMSSGFIRVNMATFDITAFAMSPNISTLYGLRGADISISNDGRYAAIKPHDHSQLRVYDINACQSTEMPVSYSTECPYRDYWDDIKKDIPTMLRVMEPRFINGSQLSFKAIYDYQSGPSFKVAKYTMTAPGEDPSGIEYLGMGDSFASGQGAFNYVLGTDTNNNTCHLSGRSYPFLLSGNLFSDGHSVACSGAKTRDIIDPSEEYEGQVKDGIIKDERNNIEEILTTFQPGYLVQNDFIQKHNPQAVTLSIGGNDVGFSDVIKQCVMPSLKTPTCYPTYEDQQELKKRLIGLGDRLKNTYSTISSPGRRVYVVGYPQIVVSGGSCAANVHLNAQEIRLFIDLTDTFNRVIQRAAESAGVQYVDVSDAFEGHRMCETRSSQVAVNGFTVGNDDGPGRFRIVGSESYHPNALGHELLAQAIRSRTNNMRAPAPASPGGALVTLDIPSGLPFAEAPRTGRTLNMTVSDTAMVPDVVPVNTVVPLKVRASSVLLRPATTYQVRLDGDSAALAVLAADASGEISGSISLPSSLACGTYTLHVYGQNMANEPVGISKVIYVTDASGGCDAGGVSGSPCGIIPASGRDADRDGVDDACDSHIADPPTYKVTITGSSIHAVRE